jgi:hypothetical protein
VIRFKGSEPIIAVSHSPFRAIRVGRANQGKPWAKLFWPLRATDWPYDRRDENSPTCPSPNVQTTQALRACQKPSTQTTPHCGTPTPADPNSRFTIWVYRWLSSWINCRASRNAATGSRSYAVRRASFSQYERLGSARISLRFILTFTARVSINLETDSAS